VFFTRTLAPKAQSAVRKQFVRHGIDGGEKAGSDDDSKRDELGRHVFQRPNTLRDGVRALILFRHASEDRTLTHHQLLGATHPQHRGLAHGEA